MIPKYIGIDEADWKPITDLVWLFELPMSFDRFKEKTGIEFVLEPLDGLGEVYGAFCTIDRSKIYLRSFLPDSGGVRMVQVYIQGQETEWDSITSRCCHAVGLSPTDISMSQEELKPGQWSLFRLDDNSNEIEMHRFPTKEHAERAREIYTARGHKQDYYVRVAT